MSGGVDDWLSGKISHARQNSPICAGRLGYVGPATVFTSVIE